MKILVTNDDGVYAPGIAALAKAMQDIADVTVVAPTHNRSGASRSLTLDRPLHVTTANNGFFAVDGTPADCVHLAVSGLFAETPDLVVSGINAGANLGDDVFYSGTVSAAIEGSFMGLPAIALSLNGDKNIHFDAAAQVAKKIVKGMNHNPLPTGTILSLNVPDVPFDQIAGYDIVRMGKRHSAKAITQQQDPRGNTIYWIGLPGPSDDDGPGTDFYSVDAKRVSITPLQLDLTHYKTFDKLSEWLAKL